MTEEEEEKAMIQFFELYADVPVARTLPEFEFFAELAVGYQRGCLWWIGDLALAVERQQPRERDHIWPVGTSPEMIDRCKAVAAAYPKEDRNPLASWSTHMKLSKRPDRVAAVQATVDAGQNSDEARRDPPPVQDTPVQETVAEKPPEPVVEKPKSRALLMAVDVNYYAHRMFTKSGVDTANQLTEWLKRLIARMQQEFGLTDVVFCFDAKNSWRRDVTEGWEQPYKERTVKDPELVIQLEQLPDLFRKNNWLCVTVDTMEADDVMASYAAQFDGRVILMTADKDLRQCLSSRVNILRDITWEENPHSGDMIPQYQWIVGLWKPRKPGDEKPENVSCHMTDGLNYLGAAVKGISPEQWPHFQAIAGDSVDDIAGVAGIGGKGAMDLILAHGTVQGVIAACKDGTANLTAKKLDAVLEFEPIAEDTLRLTTMRTDLDVPKTTRIV